MVRRTNPQFTNEELKITTVVSHLVGLFPGTLFSKDQVNTRGCACYADHHVEMVRERVQVGLKANKNQSLGSSAWTAAVPIAYSLNIIQP